MTDIPQWVVQVAEKWGLYWGGYGWSSGCQTTTQWRSSVSRDPMHFEFNGTPDEARRIANFNGPGGACFDTASNTGTISLMCLAKGQPVPAGTRVVIPTGAPPGAAASLVNITSIASANGTVTAEGCGAVSLPRQYSTMTARASRAVAATTVVPVDAKGRVCMYVSSAMHLVVDVQGFFVPAAQAPLGLHLSAITPRVTVDTRTNPFCLADDTCFDRGPVPKGDEVRITTPTALPAVGLLTTLTVTGALANGNQTAKDCATLQPGVQPFSNLNFVTGETISNLAVIRADDIGSAVEYCTYSATTLNQVNEVLGLLVPAAAGGQPFSLVTPTRLVDTRQCWTDPISLVQTCGTMVPAGGVIRIAAPAGASNLFVNVVSIDATAAGFATVRPCSATTTPPTTPTVTAIVGGSASNSSTVRVGADGTFCVYASSPMHVVVDVVGNFSATGTLRFVMGDPVRVEDTRKPG
jgi:hypothetical protein